MPLARPIVSQPQEPCSYADAVALDSVLIVKSDRFYGQCLQHAIERTMVDCTTTVVHSLADAQREIATSPRFRLVVCGIGFPDGDALAWLNGVAEFRQALHLLVVTTRGEPRVLTLLRTMPVDGVFDAYGGDMHEFTHAVTQVMTGWQVR